MKIKGFVITGIILTILGVGATAVASTQIDFKEGYTALFADPNLEEKQETFGEIQKVTYDGSDENIEIVYGEGENTFTYYESETLTYDISYDEELKELTIIQNHSFTFFSFSFGKKATLTLNSSLEELQMEASAGNIGIKDLTITKVKVDVSAGNLKIENSIIPTLDLESDAGNVNLHHVTVDSSIFVVRAGNLKIEDSKFEKSEIHANAGNVNLKDTTFNVIDAKLNAGNLKFSGDVLTRAEFKLDAGNLTLTLSRPSASYTINGEGAGTTTILYKVSAGNKNIYYAD
ncbi:MAG: DUF4097 domain-containing protein [Anaeroplasmataceae bacterium]|nr:DUF4097 domain-containing protein [Anaeroplasmataceae bacterium]MDE6413879.1 DUF4097 domain-containing protein [Anaeroplasmataceae bacterium]